jgi:endonuclease/exonuclease/phosphatase family metal-dependent hydrolase
MAPEVLGKNMYTYSADIWSMGCIFLELSQLKLEKNMYMEVFMNPGYSEDVKNLVTMRGYSTKLADLICSMLSREESARPSAAQVLTTISSMKPEPVSSIQKSAEELIAEVVDVYIGEESQKTIDNRQKGYVKIETLLKLPIVASILEETKCTDGRTVVTNALTKYAKMVEFNQDKTAVRRSKLVQKLHKAVAKYFSDERYYRDKFLLSIASHNNGCIPLTVFMSLKSISKVVLRHTGVTAERVASIVSECPEIEITEDMMVKKIGLQANATQDRWEEARFAKKVDSAFNSQWYDKHFSNTGVGVNNLMHHPRVAKSFNRNNRFDAIQAIRRNCVNVEVVERDGNIILFRKDGVNRNRQTVSSTNDKFQFGVSKCATTELTVMSFNILCDQSLENISAPFLKWANRARNMVAIIDSYKPHVICLQEVQSPNENKQRGHKLFNGGMREDHFNHMSKFLARYGYVGLYKHNMENESPTTARIGCAVFVIKEDIDIVSISNVDMSLAKLNPGVRHIVPSQGNVAQILHVKRKDQHILVCNTQLCAGDESQQLLQTQACLSGVRHHLQSCPPNTPVVLAGDLRIAPDSEVYRMICDDQMLGMKSCYKAVLGHEPLTCFKNGACSASDYIFCSKAVGIGAVLDLPNADQLRSSIQGKEFSSTHAPILVKLQMQQ